MRGENRELRDGKGQVADDERHAHAEAVEGRRDGTGDDARPLSLVGPRRTRRRSTRRPTVSTRRAVPAASRHTRADVPIARVNGR